MKTILTLLLLTLSFFYSHAQTSSTPIYVKKAATGNNDGTSWEDAYTELHDALEQYQANDQIWVAAGTYLPQVPTMWSDTITRTFYLWQDVRLYGGFNGTETSLDQRDPEANVTILSGDLNGDDILNNLDTNRLDNVTHVLYAEAVSAATIVDGFTIMGGHADGIGTGEGCMNGGGLVAYGALQVNQCRFTQNYALQYGGGLFYTGAAAAGAKVENCIFEGNQCGESGAGLSFIQVTETGTAINHCQFLQNHAGLAAAGVYLYESSAQLNDCQFLGNTTGQRAGAMYVLNESASNLDININHCLFENNATILGGAFYFVSGGGGDNNLIFTDCDFLANDASNSPDFAFPDAGAAGFQYREGVLANDTIILERCTIKDNTADRRGGGLTIYHDFGTDSYFGIKDCLFENNEATLGGGFSSLNRTTNPQIVITGTDFINNRAEALFPFPNVQGGGLFLCNVGAVTNAKTVIENCRILNNSSLQQAGGIFFEDISDGTGATLEMTGCQIEDNTAGQRFGGLALVGGNLDYQASIQNSIFSNNNSPFGLSVTCRNGSTPTEPRISFTNCLFKAHDNPITFVLFSHDMLVKLFNCTIAGNEAAGLGTAASGQFILQNTIVHSPNDPSLSDLISNPEYPPLQSNGGNLFGDAAAEAFLDATDRQNIDPLLDPNTFQPLENSPAIDAGIPLEESPLLDLLGNDRMQGGCIDIGAIESHYDAGMGCLISSNNIITNPSFLTVSPNPASEYLSLTIDNEWRGQINIRFINALGQSFSYPSFDKNNTLETIAVNLRALPKGMYEVILSHQDGTIVQSFLKL